MFGDFPTLYAAAELFLNGQPVYGGPNGTDSLLQYASAHGFTLSGPVHYPPASLLLLSLLTILPLPAALVVFSAGMVLVLLATGRIFSSAWYLPLVFLPSLVCLLNGQLGIAALGFFGVGVLVARRDQPLMAGAAIALAAVLKPMLLSLVLIDVVRCFVRAALRRAHDSYSSRLLLGVSLAVLALSVIAELVHPGIHRSYLSNVASPLGWSTPTVATALRLLVRSMTEVSPLIDSLIAWMPWLVAVCMITLFRGNSNGVEHQERRWWILLAAGVVVTPYAWWSDYVLCLPVFLFLITQGSQMIVRLALCSQIVFGLQVLYGMTDWSLTWLPVLLLAVAIYLSKSLSRELKLDRLSS